MIGGEYRSDCDCDFSIKCFFFMYWFQFREGLKPGYHHCGSVALKGWHILCNKLHKHIPATNTFCAVEFLQEFCSPDKSHKIKSVSICESCCNMLPL